MKNLLTEFTGTFFLVFTICLALAGGTAMASIPIGLALMVCVYMGGHISGAHYNPAVTLAVYLRGKLAKKDVGPYMGAQVAGALAAAAIGYVVTGQAFAPTPAERAGLAAIEVNIFAALLVEFLFTFLLALVVLNVATHPKTAGNSYYGAAIGLTVTAAAASGSWFSGGAFNPAVGVGMLLVKGVLAGGNIAPIWIYIVGPLLGGAAAAAFFKIQLGEDEAPAKA